MTETVIRADDTELVVASFGPRILGFRRRGGPDLFVRLAGDLAIDRDGGPPYRFHGGHRLWAAPEVPAVTYAPDDHDVTVAATEGTVTLTAPVDASGLGKAISATITGPGRATIAHTVVNSSGRTVALAPWAITQLRTGGTAVLPLGGSRRSDLQAERNLVAWPYTDLADPLLAIEGHHIAVTAHRSDPTKVGTTLRRGWLAYVHDGLVFVKRVEPPAEATLVDLGANGQVYCNDAFVELETLGPLVTLEPGAAAHHRETWELHAAPPGASVAEMIAALGLDTPAEGT